MYWYGEQLDERRKKDNEAFQRSLKDIAGALNDSSEMFRIRENSHALSALSDIAAALGCTYTIPEDGDREAGRDENEEIDAFCKPNGIMRRNVTFKEGWYREAIGVYLAYHKESGRMTALLPDLFGYYYKDPLTKGKKRLNRKTEDAFEEQGLVFYRPLPLSPLKPLDLIRYSFLTKNTSDLILLVVLMGTAALIGLASPAFFSFLYGTVLKQKQDEAVLLLVSTGVFYLCFRFAQTLFQSFQDVVKNKIEQKTAVSLEAGVMSRVLLLPPEFFRTYSSGDLEQRVQYVITLSNTMNTLLFGTSLSALFSLTYLISMFSFARTLVVPALIIILLTVLVSIMTALLNMRISREKMKTEVKESALEFDLLSGIQKIRLAGAEKRAFVRWSKGFVPNLKYLYNPPLFLKINTVLSSCVSLGGTFAMYYFTIRSGVSLADYTAFNVAYGMVSGAFASLASLALSASQIKPILEMAQPILDAQPEAGQNKKVLKKLEGRIEMEHVSFRYPGAAEDVIHDFSLKINSGDYVAIVGRTGCGKSTLVRLLLGFEKARKGSVFYDGQNIDALDLRSLRRNIGTVLQDGQLFSGDIYSNIVITAPWLTLEDAWKAAETAGIAEDIRQMPMEMNTLISEGEGGLSGGQKQRLLIARAVAPSPKILILDEATSALDNITQRKVCEALDQMNCTRIVIAHRLSTIRHCSRIIYMENGSAVEDGTYEELMEKKGKFAELVERQKL